MDHFLQISPEIVEINSSVASCCADKLRLCYYLKLNSFPAVDKSDWLYFEKNDFYTLNNPEEGFDVTGDDLSRASIINREGSARLLFRALSKAGFSYLDTYVLFDEFESGKELLYEVIEEEMLPFVQDNTPNISMDSDAMQVLYELLLNYMQFHQVSSNLDILMLSSKEVVKFCDYASSHQDELAVLHVANALDFISAGIRSTEDIYELQIEDTYYLIYLFSSEDGLFYNGLYGEASGIEPLYFYALKIIKDGFNAIFHKEVI